MVKTQKQLEDCCAKWQKILRLQDWDVDVQFVRRTSDLLDPHSDSLGQCMPYVEGKCAAIRIMHPDNAPGGVDGLPRLDIETTLVHELLHIPFQMFCPGQDVESLEYMLWEQAIDGLARSLVGLSRV